MRKRLMILFAVVVMCLGSAALANRSGGPIDKSKFMPTTLPSTQPATSPASKPAAQVSEKPADTSLGFAASGVVVSAGLIGSGLWLARRGRKH